MWVNSRAKYPYVSAGDWFTRYYYLLRAIQADDNYVSATRSRTALLLRSLAPRTTVPQLPSGKAALEELKRIHDGTYPYNKGPRSSEAGMG